MANWLFWVQIVAGVMTSLVALGAILTGLYSAARGTPKFLGKLTGVDGLEKQITGVDNKVDIVLEDMEKMQDLQYQQAKGYNELKETVCTELDIPPGDRPDGLDTVKIRREVLNDDHTDFTRSADVWGDGSEDSEN